MSDLIIRKAVIEEIQLIEKELLKDKENARNSDDEQMNFAIDNQLNALCRVRLRVNSLITAYDVDKVVEQLENLKKCYIGAEDAIMKPLSFEEYIQEIINNVKGGLEE